MRAVVTVVGDADTSPDELDELTLSVRREILELDVHDAVRQTGEDVPDGSKSATAVALGTLLVTLPPIVLRSLFRVLDSWVKNRPVRTIKVSIGDRTIEVSKVTRAGQDALIENFIKNNNGS